MANTVYSFGRMKVKDYDEYIERYGLPLEPILKKYNGKVLAANKKGVVVEGQEEGNWTVLIEFASGKDAFEFYASPEYAPLKDAIRRIDRQCTGNFFFSRNFP